MRACCCRRQLHIEKNEKTSCLLFSTYHLYLSSVSLVAGVPLVVRYTTQRIPFVPCSPKGKMRLSDIGLKVLAATVLGLLSSIGALAILNFARLGKALRNLDAPPVSKGKLRIYTKFECTTPDYPSVVLTFHELQYISVRLKYPNV